MGCGYLGMLILAIDCDRIGTSTLKSPDATDKPLIASERQLQPALAGGDGIDQLELVDRL